MRIRWIVAYDVSDPARLRRIHRLLRGYGDWLQMSVFRCDLHERERFDLERRLLDMLHPGEDQILFVRAGPSEGAGNEAVHCLGRPLKPKPRVIIL